MSRSFVQNWKWENVKMGGKTIFRGAYRLSGTGIADCLEITDVGCNLKQFDGLTWLTLSPIFHDRSTPITTLTAQDGRCAAIGAVRNVVALEAFRQAHSVVTFPAGVFTTNGQRSYAQHNNAIIISTANNRSDNSTNQKWTEPGGIQE